MSYVDRDRTGENVTGFVVSGLIIAAVSYALISGLAYSGIKNVIKKVTTVDVKEEKPKETPPPPPPKKIEMPPPVAPPVKVNIAVAPPVIQTVQTPPPAPPPPVISVAPPAPRFTPKSPQPKTNPGNWASTDDYPARALREERQGVTGFRLSVGPDGRATSCEVTSSSGTPELDSTTCSLVQRRARFTPATDGEGQPTSGSYNGRVRWQIPKD